LHAKALWYTGPGRTELRDEKIPAPRDGEVRVRALHSAISRGTEALVAAGNVPPNEYDRMRAPEMGGEFPFPVKYGYASVGIVESGADELVGNTVFALYPHQDAYTIGADAVSVIPDDIPPTRAVLAANMETALNAVWDGSPAPADRIAIVGAGVVGCLVAHLCGRLPGAEVTLIDVNTERRAVADVLGVQFATPQMAAGNCDVVFHTSASSAGLATALQLAGMEARIVEMSWYGTAAVTAPLGESFHSRRLQLISSQVGHVAASHRARWDYGRRLAAAIGLLNDERLDALLAPGISFAKLTEALPRILSPQSGTLCQVIDY
jgi:NADPH:quinone reductase-like Zn-dependent oxidoreductase